MTETGKYTRRKIPPGFSVGLPRQACPVCAALIDVRIKEGGQIYFIFAGKFRGGSKRGVSSDSEESENGTE